MQEGQIISFGLTVVELDGCELSACVVVPEADTQQDTRARRSPNEETAWQALMFVYNVAGENDTLESVQPPKQPVQKAVQLPHVQDEFVRRYGTCQSDLSSVGSVESSADCRSFKYASYARRILDSLHSRASDFQRNRTSFRRSNRISENCIPDRRSW